MWSAHRRARAKALKRRPGSYCRLELIPLLGILITLLIIFMVNVPIPHHGIGIHLARANHAVFLRRAIREDAMRVSILRDGQIFFGNTTVNPADLPNQIRDQLRDGGEPRVYLAVDTRARYSRVAAVVEQVRLTGVQDISFITE
jgi:biopolymer transport protein ExbD